MKKVTRVFASATLAACLSAAAMAPSLAAGENTPPIRLDEAQATAERLIRDAEAGRPAPAGPTSSTLNLGVPARSDTLTAQSSAHVRCDTTIQNPHYSRGAGGAISKLNVTCTGTGYSTVNVRVQGILQFAPSSSSSIPGGAYTTRASTDYQQTATVNGGTKTFYLPQPGSNGGTGKGWWKAYYTMYFTAPDGWASDVANPWKELWTNISPY